MGLLTGGVQVGGGCKGIEEMRFQLSGEVGKDACPNFRQPLLESFDRSGCNDGSRELIPIFHNSHRKGRPSPLGVARTLEYLEGVPSKAATSGREKKTSSGQHPRDP